MLKVNFANLAADSIEHGDSIVQMLQSAINEEIVDYSDDFVQDMDHISTAALYDGNISVDSVVYLKDNLYRCDYSYDWSIGWTCSGTQEAGRVKEKVRFTLDNNGDLNFKFLKLDM